MLACLPVADAAALPSGVTRLVNVTPAGAGGNSGFGQAQAISANGRLVLFSSDDTDLTSGPAYTANTNIFLRDVVAGTTQLVSVSPDGTQAGDNTSGSGVMSPDGRYVAFVSSATNLVPQVGGHPSYTAGKDNVFVRDMQTGTTQLASVSPSGAAAGDQSSGDPSISADGHRVAFDSPATNLGSESDGNAGGYDVFLRDVIGQTTSLVSVNAAGTAGGNGGADTPHVSADGRFVAFESEANDLVPAGVTDATNSTEDVFIRDLTNGTTQLLSVNAAGTAVGNGVSGLNLGAISADGRYVLFDSNASDLTAAAGTVDNNGQQDTFRADRQAGAIALVSMNNAGTHSAGASSSNGVISADGRFIAFQSAANDITAAGFDTNATTDIFRRDVDAGMSAMVSVDSAGTNGGDVISQAAQISADGRYVAFVSGATNLAAGVSDTNSNDDIFRRDMTGGTTQALTVNPAGTATGASGGAGDIRMSPDGRFVAFESNQSDLTSLTTAGQNIYMRGDFLPTAAFTAAPTSGTAPLAVTFDASASSDIEGLAGFGWSFGDGASGDGKTTSHTYAAAGSYTATLTATDNGGNTATAAQGISVSAAPEQTGGGGSSPFVSPTGAALPARTTGPLLVIQAAAKQRIVRQRAVLVAVQCSDEACGITANGTLSVPGAAGTFRLKAASATLKAGGRTTLKLKLTKRAITAARQALARGRKVTARVRVAATDDGGRVTRVTRAIRARA